MRTFLSSYAVTVTVLLRAAAGLALHGLLRPAHRLRHRGGDGPGGARVTSAPIGVGRNIINVVSVLALVLVVSLLGLIALGVVDGDASVRNTLTHVSETVLGVFVGLAAGRLTGTSSGKPTPPDGG